MYILCNHLPPVNELMCFITQQGPNAFKFEHQWKEQKRDQCDVAEWYQETAL